MIYSNIYSIIMDAFFTGVTVTPEITLAVTLLSLLACVFVFALPFLVVWRILRLFMGG